MKTKFISYTLASALILGSAVPAFAATKVAIKTKAPVVTQSSTTTLQHAQEKGEAAIAARITSLNELASRINSMSRLTAAQKTALTATIQAEISDLMTLQTQIQNATSSAVKTDLKTIAPNYRVYMLVEPVMHILAASDRVQNIVTSMQGVSTKLAARIAISTSTASTTLTKSLNDMNAKLTDASSQASTSISLVINLKPDQGDQTIMKANQTALKAARADLKTAQQDLVAARKDALTIMKGLGINASSTAEINVKTGMGKR